MLLQWNALKQYSSMIVDLEMAWNCDIMYPYNEPCQSLTIMSSCQHAAFLVNVISVEPFQTTHHETYFWREATFKMLSVCESSHEQVSCFFGVQILVSNHSLPWLLLGYRPVPSRKVCNWVIGPVGVYWPCVFKCPQHAQPAVTTGSRQRENSC